MINQAFVSVLSFALAFGAGEDALQTEKPEARITFDSSLDEVTLIGPGELLPNWFAEDYTVSWTGGEPPFKVILASQPCPTGSSDCLSEDAVIYRSRTCAQGPHCDLDVSPYDPEIVKMVATVIDATGSALVSPPKYVRIGTDGRFHVSNYSYVSFDSSGGCFDRRRFGPSTVDPANPDDDLFDPDEAFIRIVNDTDPPRFAWDVIDQGGSDSRVDRFEARAGFSNRLYALEDARSPQMGLLQPLTYGDYDIPDTVPYRDPPMPAPPLPTNERIIAETLLVGGGCSLTFPSVAFSLNPPSGGDPVIAKGPRDSLKDDMPDPGLLRILERSRDVRIGRDEVAVVGCMNDPDEFELALITSLVIFETCVANNACSPIPHTSAEEFIFRIVLDPVFLGLLRGRCGSSETTDAVGAQEATDAPSRGATPDLLIETRSGSGRITLPDPSMLYELRTAHGSVISEMGVVDIAQDETGTRSAIGSPDSELTVIPTNPALPETLVPAGFYVTLSDDSISEATEFALFFSGFE
jgi:hypothetical protein